MFAGRSWLKRLIFRRASVLPEIYAELKNMAEKGIAVSWDASKIQLQSMPTTLKLASDGGCHLNDEEKIRMAKQLRDASGPAHIPLEQTKLLMGIVDKSVSKYPPGGDDIEYIASAEPITPYLVDAKTQLAQPASARRVPLIPLLKLATFWMKEAD